MSSSYGPPVVPPHPADLYNHPHRQPHKPPPVPPLPPNFNPDSHLVSPMPERILPNMPSDITRTLDSAAGYMSPPPPAATPGAYPYAASLYPPAAYDAYRRPSPGPPPGPAGYPGGFARPQSAFAPQPPPPAPYGSSSAPPPPPGSVVYPTPPPHQYQYQHQHHQPPYSSPAPMPIPAYAGYSSPPPPPPHQHQAYGSSSSLTQGIDNLSLHPRPSTTSSYPASSPPSTAVPHSRPDPQASSYAYALPPGITPPPSSSPSAASADATAPIPTKELLLAVQRKLPPSPGIITHLPWIRDVLFFVERTWGKNNQVSGPPTLITDDQVARDLTLRAAKFLQSFLPAQSQSPPPEALYLRAMFFALGCAPEVYPKSAREAFRDWEASARAGWVKAWWRIGREYETTGDVARAKECFERGIKGGAESCVYRMGMAHLLGQLGLSPNPGEAMSLLHKAATLSSIEHAHPSYMYGLLLLGEFSQVKVEPRDFIALIPQGSSPTTESRKYIERAAYLHFAPAQYKLGHAYEYALPPFPYDPLLSVQYYSLASQNGEPEADMALSKWFLCGAEGAFEKDEALAVVFAEKAARKALPSAEFAMGYYREVGVGVDKDVQNAITWYEKAVAHGNTDASTRLEALKKDASRMISRTEHDELTNAKLVRRRTQAKMSAVADGRVNAAAPPLTEAQKVKAQALAAQASAAPSPPVSSMPQQYQHQHQHQHQPPPPQQHQLPPVPQQQQQPRPSAQQPGRPPQQTQYNPNAPRYSLSDGPSPSSSPAPGSNLHGHPSTNGAAGRPAGKPPGRRHDNNIHQVGQGAASPGPVGPGMQGQARPPPPAAAFQPSQPSQPAPNNAGVVPAGPPKPSGHGPATFAEMGFQAGKAEDKDCIIM